MTCKDFDKCQKPDCHLELCDVPDCFKQPDSHQTAEVLASNSTLLLCVDDRLDQAEREILNVCKKYDIDLAPKYDDGVAVVMVYSENNPDKSTTIYEREIDT